MSGRAGIRLGATGSRALNAELARALLPDKAAGEVTILGRRPLPYASTFPLEELVVRLADGSQQRLVLKDLSWNGPADPVWKVKAPFLHDPLREIDVYREVLAPNRISAPACLGTVTDPDRGRFWLFLERLDGEPLWQIGEMEVWRRAARWLAEMHGRFTGRRQVLPRRLLVRDGGYYRRWLQRAREFVQWQETSGASTHSFDWLTERTLGAVEWLDKQPATFLHGEFYPSNVLVQRGDGETRIRPLDWEMAGIGPGLLDLAALASGRWNEAQREILAETYRAALPRGLRPGTATLRRGLDRARLLLAVQWLGWSPGWKPPAEHDHDWLATALELAERCGPQQGAGQHPTEGVVEEGAIR